MKTPAQNYVESATRRLTLRLHNQPYVVLIALLVLFVLPAHSQVTNIQPTFDMGSDAGLSSGQASAAKNIGTLLHVSDMDRGQLLTWSILSPPATGTVIGFPAFALSGNMAIVPDATLYQYWATLCDSI
ncbi:MAG TPA: hypothetical protein PLJ60_14250 [Chryseolinea sp.]|mgnify:CR=1 FL=1|nr:hypothetical protein [Chryseolinea sp.]HPM31494.1 hypothetical protein [Chryseolinea sp.]